MTPCSDAQQCVQLQEVSILAALLVSRDTLLGHRMVFMDDVLYQKIRVALERSWSAETGVCFSPDADPSYGQCAQTAIVVQETFGGEILLTTGWHGCGNHFYNRINGQRIDFTADQFKMPGYSYPLTYEDRISSKAEAEKETLSGQVEALWRAFRRAFFAVA